MKDLSANPSELAPALKRRRGRPTLGESPLTPSERQRRTRDKAKKAGVKAFLLQLGGDRLDAVEELATLMEVSRAEAMRLIFDAGLSNLQLARLEAKQLIADDAPIEQIIEVYGRAFGMRPPTEGGGNAG